MTEPYKRRTRRIPVLPDHWQDYIACVVLHLVLPLLPLVFELSRTGSLSASTSTLSAAMYTIAVGVSSENKAVLALCFPFFALYVFRFGSIQAAQSPATASDFNAMWAIGAAFVLGAAQRYNLHVADRAPYKLFTSSKGEDNDY